MLDATALTDRLFLAGIRKVALEPLAVRGLVKASPELVVRQRSLGAHTTQRARVPTLAYWLPSLSVACITGAQ
jgi:hypothetical protein